MSAKDNAFDLDRNASAIIYGLSGFSLSDDEIAFFKEANPFGFILFKRNCDTPQQVKAITQELRNVVGRNCPILIDQEGGRVQRLNVPHWRGYPNARQFGEQAENKGMEAALESLRFNSLQMIDDLKDCGINVNCTPVADVLSPETHDVIGDRAFSDDPAVVSRMALSVARHYLNCGVTPIIKHIPGHGRAAADSHLELPIVNTDAATLMNSDFKPFADIAASEIGKSVWAMSAHVIYSALDKDLPATISPEIISKTIRKDIGFDGILISDDLDMKALAPYGDQAAMSGASIKAGCDLALHCSGDMDVMKKIAGNTPKISDITLKRLQNAAALGKVAA